MRKEDIGDLIKLIGIVAFSIGILILIWLFDLTPS